MKGKNRIIVPLDVDSIEGAIALVRSLRDHVGGFKIGFELIMVMLRSILEPGDPEVAYRNMMLIRELYKLLDGKHFKDAKLHDIPNTVKGAVKAITGTKVDMLNVHCSGCVEMMKSAKVAAIQEATMLGIPVPKVIGVTLLTSLSPQDMVEAGLIDSNVITALLTSRISIGGSECSREGIASEHQQKMVVNLAKAAKTAGLDGVVASPKEIKIIKEACGKDFLVVTPGVRPAGSDVDDQKRVMTPGEATELGADYLVIGRPITKAEDPVAAAQAIAKEIDEALTKVRSEGDSTDE